MSTRWFFEKLEKSHFWPTLGLSWAVLVQNTAKRLSKKNPTSSLFKVAL